jgi:predicted RNase H-like HicB family nuclease
LPFSPRGGEKVAEGTDEGWFIVRGTPPHPALRATLSPQSGARGNAELSSQVTTMKPDPRYEVIIYWSAEDEAYIAEVPELPGCAADGATYEAALSNVRIVIDEWIETAQQLGRPVPEPRGRLMYA